MGFLVLVLTGLPAGSQSLTSIQQSLDNLEYRVGKIESELGSIRKGPAPSARPAPRSRADSLVPGMAARLDSLMARLAKLESKDKAAAIPEAGAPASARADSPAVYPSVSPAPAAKYAISPLPPDTAGRGDIAGLRSEIRTLTALLKGMGEPHVPPATGPADRAPRKAPVPTALVPSPAPAAALSGLELKGDIQIQGERRFATGTKQDNLDDFWGRLNFGAEYQGEGFQSKANIRIFPEGFGFEPLTGATFDTAGQGSLKVQAQPMSRVVVNHAWVRFTPGPIAIKFGRFETQESQSASLGNYIDLGPGGRFLSRPAAHNAVEAAMEAGPSATSLILGAGDRKLNRGFLRALQKYRPAKGVLASLGYRVNAFDRFKYADEELLQRFDAGLACPLPGGWKAFAEGALLQVKNKDDDTPILLGIQPFTGKALDLLSAELEWMPGRQAAGKDREVLFNLYARKSFGRLKAEAAVFSDASRPDADAWGMGLRITTGLR